MAEQAQKKRKLTWQDCKKMKQQGEKIVMLTAYDFSAATLAEAAGVDVLLVGDSLGNVVLGYDTTLQVTMADMIHHTKPVVRGAQNTLVITDMPFGSYEVSPEQAVANAIRIIKEGGCDGVKLEGGNVQRLAAISAITAANVPVVGHLGLTPQRIIQLGGFKVQGKTNAAAQAIIDEAKALEAAGAVMIVLECIPAVLAEAITAAVSIPTIGIGAGAGCDGQVLVWYDMVGMYDGFQPKFVKHFAEAGQVICQGMAAYVAEVKAGSFPAAEHTFAMAEKEELKKLY